MATLATLGHSPYMHDKNTITCALGRIDLRTGTLKGTARAIGNETATLAEIKRAYSGEVIKSTARKYGWQCKPLGNHKYQVIKVTL